MEVIKNIMGYADKIKRQEEKTSGTTGAEVKQPMEPTPKEGIICNSPYVLLRSAPDKSYKAIAIPVSSGTRVSIVGDSADGAFYKVQLAYEVCKKIYYVDKKYCKLL